MVNVYVAYNFSHFSTYLPKIIKIDWNLTKFWQKQFCTVFSETPCSFGSVSIPCLNWFHSLRILWNALSHSVRSTFLTGSLLSSYMSLSQPLLSSYESLKTSFVFLWVSQKLFFRMVSSTLAAILNGSPHKKWYTNA